MERDFDFEKDSWVCPRCTSKAHGYFCGQCGFKIYAGFSYRFVAALIDALICTPFFLVISAFENPTIETQIFILLIELLFYIFYYAIPSSLWGQTFGKMFARIKILRLDGSQIRWSNAWLRYSVNIIGLSCGVFLTVFIGYKTSMTQAFESAYSQLPEFEWVFVLLGFLVIGTNVYDWSEVLVLLTNKKRRAIHDFIANTVVIHDPRLTRKPWKLQAVVSESRPGN